MFRFMMKKSFCDAWDNLVSIIITNVLCVFSLVGFLWLLTAMANKFQNDWILFGIIIVASMFISILIFAFGDSCAKMANFDSVKIVDYFKAIPHCIKDGALFGLMNSAVGIGSYIAVCQYWSEQFLTRYSLWGVFLGAVVIWIDFFYFLSIQWFLPIRSLMHNNFKKCLKKSFIIFFDNTGFSLLMFLYDLLLTVISVIAVGFIPSFGGILVAKTNALRLRLYKYDYLDAHPELQSRRQRRKIPWEELLYDDKELLGPRKLKSFLFPWKED